MNSYQFRDNNLDTLGDSTYGVRIVRYDSTDAIPWRKLSENVGEGVRIIVQRDPSEMPLDMLYVPKGHDDLLVGLHGAIDRKRMSLPVFQFLRTFKSSRRESFLLIADPTVLTTDTVRIGWYFGDEKWDATKAYAEVLKCYQASLEPRKVIICGHSAGGFAAARLGLHVPDSLSIVVNAQFDLAYHRQWDITRLKNAITPYLATNEEFLSTFRARTTLDSALLGRADGATVVWYSHVDDQLSFGDNPHCDLFAQATENYRKRFAPASRDRVAVVKYANPKGDAHGLPGTFIPFIEDSLGEAVSMDLRLQN